VRIYSQDMVTYRLTSTVLAASVRTVEDVLSLLDQHPLTGEEAVLTRRVIASAYTVAATPQLSCGRPSLLTRAAP
jgi:hypothetical protein